MASSGFQDLSPFMKQAMNDAEPLSLDEQFEIFRRMDLLESEEDEAEWLALRNRLVMSELRFVARYIADNYYLSPRLDYEDMVSAGIHGTIIAAERFDYRRGFVFRTYSKSWIRRMINLYIQNQAFVVYVPPAMQALADSLKKLAEDIVSTEQNSSITRVEIARRMKLDDRKIAAVIQAMHAESVEDLADNNEHIEAPAEEEDQKFVDYFKPVVDQVLAALPYQERDIICRYYGLGCPPQTLAEIGSIYAITRERIRQIKNEVEKKIKGELEAVAASSSPPRVQAISSVSSSETSEDSSSPKTSSTSSTSTQSSIDHLLGRQSAPNEMEDPLVDHPGGHQIISSIIFIPEMDTERRGNGSAKAKRKVACIQ